jgi:hypothetical protein
MSNTIALLLLYISEVEATQSRTTRQVKSSEKKKVVYDQTRQEEAQCFKNPMFAHSSPSQSSSMVL